MKTSSPGKIMLFGEHAVIYDRPCVVLSVDHRMSVFLKKRQDNNLILNASDLQIENVSLHSGKAHFKKMSFVLSAVNNFFSKYKIKSGLDIETKSEFSDQVGLGSSSAVVVSIIKSLSALFGVSMNEREIFDLAYKAVLDVQGLGSGFDVAAAVYGGGLFFKTGGKVIERIDVPNMPLVVGYTGIKADTPTLVKIVEAKLKENPKKINAIFNLICDIVELAKIALKKQDWQKTGKLMNLNHKLLRGLGVSSPELENLTNAALSAGAYGAKLSGAGGGDCMIAIGNKNNLAAIKSAIESAGGAIINANIPAQGVRLD